MTKIWTQAFWKPAPADAAGVTPPPPLSGFERAALFTPIIVMCAITVTIGIWVEPFLAVAERAAQELIDPAGYVGAVLGGNRDESDHPRRQGLELAFYFLYELVVSSFRVAWEVVTARTYSKPGIIAVPLDVRSDLGITLLANLVSLTPGSLSLEVSPDRRVLYVHVMFIENADTERDNIKNNFERRVMEVVE